MSEFEFVNMKVFFFFFYLPYFAMNSVILKWEWVYTLSLSFYLLMVI